MYYTLKKTSMKKILILQLRPEQETADDEYRAFLEHSKLNDENFERVRTNLVPFPDINLDDYSAIIIGGGPQNISDPEDKKSEEQKTLEANLFKLLDKIVEKDFPLLAACLGIGLVVTHQKGIVSSKYGESVEPITISLTEAGQKDDLLKNISNPFKAYVGHKEACETLSDSCTLLASGENCPTQMFKVKENIYVTQFHPELDLEGVKTRVEIYKHNGYFKPEEADAIIRQAAEEDLSEAHKIIENFVNKYHR